MMVGRRPTQSAKSPAMRAPKLFKHVEVSKTEPFPVLKSMNLLSRNLQSTSRQDRSNQGLVGCIECCGVWALNELIEGLHAHDT